MDKHTPGPWNYNRGEKYVSGFYGSVNVRKVAIKPEAELTNWSADARLIAAAPEMLSELKRMVRAYVSLLESGRDRIISLSGDCDPVDVMEAANPNLIAAKAAIAKAEGRS